MTFTRPRKRFGQHFLRDPAVLARIVEAVTPALTDKFVEIGPGDGALTSCMLAILPHMYAVEIDRDLTAMLRERFPAGQLDLVEGDALATDFSQFPDGARLIGNLPYNISTPLIFHLCAYAGRFLDMHFMLQKEVVDRMAAKPSSAAYGRLSVMTQHWFRVEPLFSVPPTAFYPPPKVESKIVRLLPRSATDRGDIDQTALERVVVAAFSHRRKMLRNAFDGLLSPSDLALAGVEPKARAQDLGLADYIALARLLKS